MTPSVHEAYRVCREIARREAKNFYYAFVALPAPKRDAICAVYAFMRHADDVADDESVSRARRGEKLALWLEGWHRAAAGEPTDDAVFAALRDARQRFQISLELLDQLVQGTAMDLQEGESAAGYSTFATFDDLYRYCYYVASVVGLVCIRIFGYTDGRAEKLAEETGIAFQLTNILRDVREDAERGRVYLPLEDLDRHGVSPDELAALPGGRRPTANQRALLAAEAERAERYYRSSRALLPLIAADSRPALWVLVTIYHRLLQRIEGSGYDVFSTRIAVPTATKLWILFCGLVQVGFHRLGGRSA